MARKPKGGTKPKTTGGHKRNKWDALDMANKLDLVEGWARDGATDQFIFEALGISQQTFYMWRSTKPEFAEALRKGKEIIDRQVENALLRRALGYKYDEVTQMATEKLNPETGHYESVMIEVKRVTKEVQPDTTAQIFWLKNRKPDTWRDKKTIDANLNHNGFDYMSDEELAAELERLSHGQE